MYLLFGPLSVGHLVVEDDLADGRVAVVGDPPADVDGRRRRLDDVHRRGLRRLCVGRRNIFKYLFLLSAFLLLVFHQTDWLLDWSLGVQWARLLITYPTSASLRQKLDK